MIRTAHSLGAQDLVLVEIIPHPVVISPVRDFRKLIQAPAEVNLDLLIDLIVHEEGDSDITGLFLNMFQRLGHAGVSDIVDAADPVVHIAASGNRSVRVSGDRSLVARAAVNKSVGYAVGNIRSFSGNAARIGLRIHKAAGTALCDRTLGGSADSAAIASLFDGDRSGIDTVCDDTEFHGACYPTCCLLLGSDRSAVIASPLCREDRIARILQQVLGNIQHTLRVDLILKTDAPGDSAGIGVCAHRSRVFAAFYGRGVALVRILLGDIRLHILIIQRDTACEVKKGSEDLVQLVRDGVNVLSHLAG